MKCLVLAAGDGGRLADVCDPGEAVPSAAGGSGKLQYLCPARRLAHCSTGQVDGCFDRGDSQRVKVRVLG